MICSNCGCSVNENQSYCSQCGSRLDTQKQHTTKSIDQYEQLLVKKQKMERIGKRTWISISIILDIIILINNLGYSDIFEILIVFGMVDAIVYVIYGVVAASLGFFKAEIYLEKYRQLKEEVGKAEAIKIIEDTYHPESGFNYMKNIIKGTGTLLGGCLSSIIGLAVTVIAVVVCMAFC